MSDALSSDAGCSNCGHDGRMHSDLGCVDRESWFDGRRARSGPCSCQQFLSSGLSFDEIKDTLEKGAAERRAVEKTIKRSPRR